MTLRLGALSLRLGVWTLRLNRHRLAVPVAAAALLGIAYLVPATGFGLWLRLAAATLVLLLPGRLVALCLGQRGLSAALAWSVVLVGCGLALAFALADSLDVTLAFVLGAGAVALAVRVAERSLEGERLPYRARLTRGVLAFAGLLVGAAVWSIQGALSGDAFFHLGRIRKLDALGSLSLHDVGEFFHGSLHPGYAFPLWHGWIAVVAKLAGVDPTAAALHESSLLAPLAFVLAFEMGWAVFRSTSLAFAVVLAQIAIKLLAAGHGGVYPNLWEPATATTQLFVPATIALFFGFVRAPSRPLGLTLAGSAAVIALVHPTYALFLGIPLGAFAVVRALVARGADLRPLLGGLAALAVPAGLVYAWLEPTVHQTLSVNPSPEQLARSLHHYRFDLVVQSLTRYNLSPQRVDRAGSVVVAALLLAPLALLERRRRWSALVLGGVVAVLTLELWPLVFPHFSDLVSLSQSRRAAAFIPFAIAFAGGAAVLSRFSRTLVLALALGCGIWLQVTYGGDFGLRAPRTVPAVVVWVALYGTAAAIVVAVALRLLRRELPVPKPRRDVTAALAALLFVLPVAVHGFSRWTPLVPHDSGALSPGLVRFLRHDVPPRASVFADLGTSYRIVAYAPVYAVALPPTHVANTRENQIFVRRHAWLKFLLHPSLYEPRRWRAGWLVLRRDEPVAAVEARGLKPAYADSGFVVFKVPLRPLPLSR